MSFFIYYLIALILVIALTIGLSKVIYDDDLEENKDESIDQREESRQGKKKAQTKFNFEISWPMIYGVCAIIIILLRIFVWDDSPNRSPENCHGSGYTKYCE
jgi:hypothetical protein